MSTYLLLESIIQPKSVIRFERSNDVRIIFLFRSNDRLGLNVSMTQHESVNHMKHHSFKYKVSIYFISAKIKSHITPHFLNDSKWQCQINRTIFFTIL